MTQRSARLESELNGRIVRLESELTQRTLHLEEAIRTVGIAAEHRKKLQEALDELEAAHRQLVGDFEALKRESRLALDEHRIELGRRSALALELGQALRTLESRLDGLAKIRAEEAASKSEEATATTSAAPEGSLLKRLLGGRAKPQAEPDVPSRLKILFVLHQFLPRHVAGTEVYTANLTRALRERGHEAVVLCCEAHHDKTPFTHLRREMEGMRIHEVVQNYTWDSFEATYNCPPMEAMLESVLDEERPDVVHVQHLHYFSAGFLRIIRERGIPIVYHLHDYMILCPRDGQMRREDGEICATPIPEKCAECIAHHPLNGAAVPSALRPFHPGQAPLSPAARQAAMRAEVGLDPFDTSTALPIPMYARAITQRLEAWKDAARHVDLFVSPSRFLRDLFVKEGVATDDRIIVSDNGQDTSRFASTAREDAGGPLRIGFIGSIAEHKGLHVLIDAMNALPHDLPAECAIWGDGRAFIDYTESLRTRITHPRTVLKGPFDPQAIAAVLSTIDVLVVPSLWYENSPLTVHEAQMAHVPVIASDIGGLAEYVIEGRNGMRFHMGDADDLRKKILWFLEDPRRAASFDFATIPIKDIAQDAEETEARYKSLLRTRRLRV
jgi:glycosyltransferase involved in cell wall biosynthesis